MTDLSNGLQLPNETIYLNNINEKIKTDVLKKNLYMLLSQYGKIKQIIACKGIKMRGQAWVIYHDVNSAINAMKGKQGFMFYDKPLRLAFAKSKSHVIIKKQQIVGGGKKSQNKINDASTNLLKRNRDVMVSDSADIEELDGNDDDDNNTNDNDDTIQHRNKASRVDTSSIINNNNNSNNDLKSKILFLQNLPLDYEYEQLFIIFQNCPGMVELRMAPGNKGIAFVEFENEVQSSMALRQLSGYQLTATHLLQISYSN